MYVEAVDIKHIRAIESLKIKFSKPAGWHVIIGDNGTGKSSVVRAIALALIGPEKALALRLVWDDWLAAGQRTGHIKLTIAAFEWDRTVDTKKASVKTSPIPVPVELTFTREKVENPAEGFAHARPLVVLASNIKAKTRPPSKELWSDYAGWFSAAYGPFRRFTGGNPDWNKLFYSSPKVGAHLSAFGEDVALTEALEWLRELDYQRLKQQEADATTSVAGQTLEYIKRLINDSGLLPHGAKLVRIEADGPVFLDGNDNAVPVTQLSDGYRSVLSLTPPPKQPAQQPPAGTAVLLNPRLEDPMDFFMLDLRDTFEFVIRVPPGTAEYERAHYTLHEVLALNEREFLREAREESYGDYRDRLHAYVTKKAAGAPAAKLDRMRQQLQKKQHPSVWKEAQRYHRLGLLAKTDPDFNNSFLAAPEALTW